MFFSNIDFFSWKSARLGEKKKKKHVLFLPLSLGTGERQPTLFAEESLSAVNHWILN